MSTSESMPLAASKLWYQNSPGSLCLKKMPQQTLIPGIEGGKRGWKEKKHRRTRVLMGFVRLFNTVVYLNCSSNIIQSWPAKKMICIKKENSDRLSARRQDEEERYERPIWESQHVSPLRTLASRSFRALSTYHIYINNTKTMLFIASEWKECFNNRIGGEFREQK